MRTLVLQRGHVPRTTGATGTATVDGDLTEQEFAVAAAAATVEALEPYGDELQVKVIDADPPTSSYAGDAFIALHCDGSTNRAAHGACTGYRTAEGSGLARLWKAAYHDEGWLGGWVADNYTAALAGYYGVSRAVSVGNRPAVILEHGHLTNPDDATALGLPDGPDRTAAAIRRAVTALFGLRPVNDEDQEERMALAAIVKGDKRGDGWVLGPDGAVVPLGGRENASIEDQRAHRDLLVLFGLARVDKDGSSFEIGQGQVDVLPRLETHAHKRA